MSGGGWALLELTMVKRGRMKTNFDQLSYPIGTFMKLKPLTNMMPSLGYKVMSDYTTNQT